MASEMHEGVKLGMPGHSLSLRYELELQEQEVGGAPTLSRVNKCFQILDEIIPHLGVYQRVIQLVKHELHVAVYSSDWTSSPRVQKQACKSGGNTNLSPLPYFVIAQRLTEKKAGERSKFKAEISSLKEQLYTCEADLEKATSSLDSYRHDLKDREAKVHHLAAELRTHFAEKEHLQEIISKNQHSKERLCQEFDFRMFSLKNTIASLKEENGKLKAFKFTHDQLQETKLITASIKDMEESSAPANSMNELEQHITTTEKLRFQLLSLQNSLMEELDSWLLSCYNTSQVLQAEVVLKQKTFKHKISALSTELSLLDKHQQILSGRLQQLRNVKTTSFHLALVLPLHPLNPLIPQEQISSKYAAMIYTSSDGGKSFYPLKVAQHCSSCAQKTVLCPHKVCEDDLVVQIPVNTTHLKISRPSFKLTRSKPHPIQPVPQKVALSTPINQGLHVAVPDFGYLWVQFNKKFPNFELTVPRKITQEQLLELVEQFYAALLLQDDRWTVLRVNDEDDDDTLSLPESLFEFMHQHYVVRSLAPISCHAFISSLEQFHSRDKELSVLSHALCGELDGCSFRYTLLQADLVEAVTWTSHSQFSGFVTSLYPFIGEEDVEQLGLNYIAHSDNHLSAKLVLDFLQLLLLAHKDPLVIMLEGKLTEQPCRIIGCMLETEFAEAMEKVVPTSSDLLCRHLFLQTLSSFQNKTDSSSQNLPTRKLAYIAAYLYRSSMQSKLKEDLAKLKIPAETADSGSKSRPSGCSQSRLQESRSKRSVVHTSMDTVRKVAERVKTLNTIKRDH